MFSHSGGNRGKHLQKILQLLQQLPDKEDQKDGGIDEAGEVDSGGPNQPIHAPQTGALPAHGFPQKKQGFK